MLSVAKLIHVALIAILGWFMKWPDFHLALRFVTGFRLTGRVETTGVFLVRDVPEPVNTEVVLQSSRSTISALKRANPSLEAQFLWESCQLETEKGWAGGFASEAEFNQRFGIGRWMPLPSFVVTQEGGKRRRIDDAKKYGHNTTSAPSEELKMCSAFAPALSARALLQAAKNIPDADLRLFSGTEDLPNAYRSLPVAECDHAFNILALHDPCSGNLVFQQGYALYFGWSTSVYNFSRWSCFLEAASRRILAC